VLTARSENFLRGNPSLEDTIRRLQAFERAERGRALRAPGLPDLAVVQAVCAAVSRPVNFMAGIKGSRSASPSSKRRVEAESAWAARSIGWR
jgi:2-methylisocitrate lyase-like PEP mutase family enzyme